MNRVLLGDNLTIMKGLPEGSVDLVYADPPFFTGRDWRAFDDRWDSLDNYLNFMKARLVEIKRLLSPSGSLYLHCDSNASHYLKVMLDDLLGRQHFRNEIIWCYVSLNFTGKQFPRQHDTILWYSTGVTWAWNPDLVRVPYSPVTLTTDGRPLAGILKGYTTVLHPEGKVVEDWWQDIKPISRQPAERTGYPTQKPVALLERIIKASSNEGDVVLDPFCGSGTTLVAAERLGRSWIGIDSNPEAVNVAKGRLKNLQPYLLA